MLHELVFEVEFFARLEAVDAQIAAQVAAQGRLFCCGPLHQANYLRKPRGALLTSAGEHPLLAGFVETGTRIGDELRPVNGVS